MNKLERYRKAIANATADGNEEAVAELKRRLQAAADSAAAEDNQEAFGNIMEVITGESRSSLESQMVEAKQEQAQAQRRLEGSQDTMAENLLEGAGEMAAGINSMFVGGADLLTSPVRALYNQFAGEGEQIGSVADLFPEGYRPGEGGFIEEPTVQQTVETIGQGIGMGVGFAPVQRAEGGASMAAELLGFGTTKGTAADDVVNMTEQALTEFQNARGAADMTWYDQYLTGVSDAISRRVSPQVGARVQRADETAMRINTKEMEEFVAPIAKSIDLADSDEAFKALLLDYGAAKASRNEVRSYVTDKLGAEEASNLMRYLNWSANKNARYNKSIGDSSLSGNNYLHTQVKEDSVITGNGRRSLNKKQSAVEGKAVFDDDTLAIDAADLERTRGSAVAGDVRVAEYENPLLSNARRIQHNERLLELSRKFGLKDVSGGPNAWLDALEKQIAKKGVDEYGSRDARNAIAALLKGQNKAAHPTIQALQSGIYAGTLAGPKSALLNLHDIPMAAVNNGLRSMMGLLKSNGTDLKSLGISGQTMGEFTQNVASVAKDRSLAQKISNGTHKFTSNLMAATGFRLADSVGKRGVINSVAENSRRLAKEGNLASKWGDYFDASELERLQKAITSTGGNASKMSKPDAKLYEELLTAGLGQQQLISAAGRPIGWLDNPNMRWAWVMRGFAIKQQALLMKNVVGNLKAGKPKEAAEYAARYVALGGGGYAVINQLRQEIFSDKEASVAGGVQDVLDQVVSAASMNTLSVSPYALDRMEQNGISQEFLTSLLPPGGAPASVIDSVVDAIVEGDPEKLTQIITDLPAYKQIESVLE